ncbi:MAG TPA: hypothetical protein VHC18_25665 [Amycolatopsis sp.]|nr:hypothetical protein [Amycolatopsis sp.]
MTFDASGIAGLVVVVPLLLWALWALLHPAVFRFVVLPSMGRKRGWRTRGMLIGYEPEGDLAGDGSQGWDTPLPGTTAEFLGSYGNRPVHGVEVSMTHWLKRFPGARPRKIVRFYSVVSVAVSDRPFGGFNASRRGTVVNGDAMAFYPDFVEWARNRRLQDAEDALQEHHGIRSISWFGTMSRRRVRRALDRLTAQAR